MTAEMLETAKERLMRKLALPNPDPTEDALMDDALSDAEGELLLYLNWETLTDAVLSKLVELAALFFRRDTAGVSSGAVKSRAYSEGKVSQSETYLSGEDYNTAARSVLDSLAKYREVRVR